MYKIIIEFDEANGKVLNTVVETSTGKTVRQRTKKASNNPNSSKPIVEVDTNKLILTDAVLDLLEAEAEDRIAVNYYEQSKTEHFPLIGRSDAFADKLSGNKLTKSNTVAFRGKQRDVLVEYGTLFTLEPFKQGQFKLIPIDNIDEIVSADETIKENLEVEEAELQELNNEEIENEISKFIDTAEEDVDDLPF